MILGLMVACGGRELSERVIEASLDQYEGVVVEATRWRSENPQWYADLPVADWGETAAATFPDFVDAENLGFIDWAAGRPTSDEYLVCVRRESVYSGTFCGCRLWIQGVRQAGQLPCPDHPLGDR